MRDIRTILSIEDNELQLSRRVDEIDPRTESKLQRDITKALKDTLNANKLTALSAPAIGEEKRIFVINFREEIKTFINPIIVQAKGMELSLETCSSIPGKRFLVPRNNDIMVVYQRPMGKIEQRQLIGRAAFVFQHELQHLDGLLISDIGLEIDDDFDNAPEEEKNEVIQAYLESLDIRRNELHEEIQATPELKQLSDGIDFMTSVYTGKTKIEPIKEDE